MALKKYDSGRTNSLKLATNVYVYTDTKHNLNFSPERKLPKHKVHNNINHISSNKAFKKRHVYNLTETMNLCCPLRNLQYYFNRKMHTFRSNCDKLVTLYHRTQQQVKRIKQKIGHVRNGCTAQKRDEIYSYFRSDTPKRSITSYTRILFSFGPISNERFGTLTFCVAELERRNKKLQHLNSCCTFWNCQTLVM